MKKNIIKRSLKHTALLFACLALGSSCTKDFVTINTKPYSPTEEDMKGDNYSLGGFIPQMEQNVISTQNNQFQLSQNLIGDIYSGYMAGINNFNSNKNNSTYFFQPSWLNNPFTTVYSNEFSAWLEIKNKTNADPNSHVFALAQIIKIASMSRLTDMWGPIPYSDVDGVKTTSAYDSQESVYRSFFTELGAAITTLNSFVINNPGNKPMAEFDLVYGGDYAKWVKFANSLRLRLAMRVVYVDPQLAQQEAEKSINDQGGLITSNADNATLTSGSGTNIVNQLFTMWSTYGDCRVGANITSVMSGYNDPRLPAYFQTSVTGGLYRGVRTGINISAKANYSNNYSAPQVVATDPIVWMNAAEVSFLKAEGALRGWAMGTSAAAAYAEGVSLSFDEHGKSGAASYLANNTSQPANYSASNSSESISAVSHITIQWNDSDPFETKLERLITQKWIATYPNGPEAWAEFRRTGYPKLFPVIVSYDSSIPNTPTQQVARMPFPANEYTLNPDNIQAAVTLLGGPDTGATKLWWDKKTNK